MVPKMFEPLRFDCINYMEKSKQEQLRDHFMVALLVLSLALSASTILSVYLLFSSTTQIPRLQANETSYTHPP